MKKSKRKQLIKKLLKNDMGFFSTPSKDRRIVIDVIDETKTPVIEININITITGITKDFPVEKTIKAINEKTIVDGYSSLLI